MAEGDLSMLDKMASGVMERKEAAAARAKLTPVKGEKAPPTPGLPDVPGVFLTNEALAEVADDLRLKAQVLLDVALGIDQTIGRRIADPEAVQDVKADEKAADKAAKARKAAADKPLAADTTAEEFAAKQAAQRAEAEASLDTLRAGVADSTVEGGEDPTPQDIAPADDGLWRCPDHGTRQETKSRKGRDMVACGSYPDECQKFELPA